MNIQELFKKPIDRQIQGVIKIGQKDQENIHQELEEYVVTEELHKHLESFFDQYNQSLYNPVDNIGVWISGFFGSGKSHFLKILSYLLNSDLEVAGKTVPDYFEGKVSEKLLQQIKEANRIPTDVILFNIDSKSDADNKQNKMAIVKVFNKVFNEMRGYSPSHPWLAQLEETLDKKGEYKAFKEYFEEESGLSWEDGREELFYNEDEVILALTKATNNSEESARRWIENGEANFELSIDDFATRIKEYIDKKPENYHLVFCVDEVGQYISDNTSLMLNLQSLSEDISKYCEGKVWIAVTSQQEIDALKDGGMAATDFSKIQARYATRLSLSSANADEVIKKRLLEKTKVATDTLRIVYDEKEASLKNALTFTGTVNRSIYKDRDEFAEVYPFIPYQISLLQTVFTEVRNHSALGRHLADGERNLLGAVQDAVKQKLDNQTDILISFDQFYDNLNQMLDHTVQNVFANAKRIHKLEDFDIRVLKVLFLVRYVESFQKDIESLSTLLISEIDQDRVVLQRKLSDSLEKLQKEYLIQRRGKEYFFLTDEEQDVNREIQNIVISTSQQVKEIGRTIYEDILEMKKYTHFPFEGKRSVQYTFDVSQWIDNQSRSNLSADIGVRVLTMFAEEEAPEQVRQLSMREDQVIIVLPMQGTYYEDMDNYLRIVEYIRLNSAKNTNRIIFDKVHERDELTNDIRTQLRTAMETAEYYVHGSMIETSTNIMGNIERGLSLLVNEKFVKLPYVKEAIGSDKELIKILDNQQNTLLTNVDDDNQLATEEIERHIELLQQRHIMVSLKELVEKFKTKPYGWKEMDILGSMLWLLKEEKITFTMSNKKMQLAPSEDFVRVIMKTPMQEKIAVAKREVVADKYIKAAKGLTKEMFGVTVYDEKEDDMFREIQKKFVKECENLGQLKNEYRFNPAYPGEKEIEEGIHLYEKMTTIQDAFTFFKMIYEMEDELLDMFELLMPIKQFFEHHRTLFDDAYKISEQYTRDKYIILSEEVQQSGEAICAIVKKSQPYQEMKKLPQLIERYRASFMEELELAAKPIKRTCKDNRQTLLSLLGDTEQEKLLEANIQKRYEQLAREIDYAERISDLNALKAEVEDTSQRMGEQINYLQEKERKAAEEKRQAYEKLQKADREDEKVREQLAELEEELPKEPTRKNVILSKEEIIPTKKIEIASEADIDRYINEIKHNLQAKIKDGSTLTIM